MNDTSKSAMTREEAKELIESAINSVYRSLPKGGANVNVGVQDQRFTKLINWVWASIGLLAVSGVIYLGTAITGAKESIVELNGKITVLIAQRDADVNRVSELTARVQILEAERRK